MEKLNKTQCLNGLTTLGYNVYGCTEYYNPTTWTIKKNNKSLRFLGTSDFVEWVNNFYYFEISNIPKNKIIKWNKAKNYFKN